MLLDNILGWLSSNEQITYPFRENLTLKSEEGPTLPTDFLIDAVAMGGKVDDVFYLSSLKSTPELIILEFKMVRDGLVVGYFEIPRETASVRKMFYSGPIDPDKISGITVAIPGLVSSGAAPYGGLEPNFALISSPSTLLAYVLTPGTFPGLWTAVVPAGSAWIGPDNPNASVPPRPTGLYVYQLTLPLEGLDISTISVSGFWASDNNAEVYVNGVFTGISTPRWGFVTTQSFSIDSSYFIEGVNTIQVRVENPFGGGLLSGLSPTGFFMHFPDPYVTTGLTPGSDKLPPGTTNTIRKLIPQTLDMKIVIGPAVLTLPDGLDLTFTADTAELEPSVMAPAPIIVESLADRAAPKTRLVGDVFIGEGFNMSIDVDEASGVLTFNATSGAGLGAFYRCTPFEEIPRRLRFVNGLKGRDKTQSLAIAGDKCIEVQNRPEDHMIVLYDHCRPCCDCDLLADFDARLIALGG